MDSLEQEIREICALSFGEERVRAIRDAIERYLSCDCGRSLGRGVCHVCDRDI